MKPNIKKTLAVFALLTALFQTSKAQHVESMSMYIFSQDSLVGFDEQAASAGALANGFFGKEYKVFMYRAKRIYLAQKYNIQNSTPKTLFQNPTNARPMPVNGGACNNEDFELATSTILPPITVQGWTIQSGINGNSCGQPTLTASSFYTVYTAPVSDSRIPGNISSYFNANSNTVPSGNAFIRLNDDNAGLKAVRMSKSFIPTPTSALFQYAYIAVIEDGSHACCDQAGFNIKVTVTNTVTNTSTLLACPNISIAVPGAACSFTIPPGGPSFSPCIGQQGANWSYANWTTSALDLTQYINFMVQIDITVVDCTGGVHGAYFYFDAKCSPMVVTGNGTPFAAGTQSVVVPTCGSNGATICATPGLGPYSWAGPNVPSNYSVPSLTNTCFTSSLSATYTLYMEPPGSCAPIARVINTTITPAPLLLASVKQAGCGDSLAVITLTPSGSAAVPSSITWSPTPLLVSSSTIIATYTSAAVNNTNVVTVTATDPLGCMITQTVGIIHAASFPTLSILNTTGSPSITCAIPVVTLSAQSSYTYGTLTYYWSTNSNTYTTNEINISAAATVTCLIEDPATNCKATQTIAIGINTIAPLTTISPSIQNITCNSTAPITVSTTANPSVNVTQNILSPYGGTASATSHTMIYIPACGVYTHVVVNDINGCLTTKQFTVFCSQGFPTFNVISAQNFTLGCTSKSCAVVSIVNGNTDPWGGPVSYTLIPPASSSSVTPPGTLTTTSVYTVCTPGTYTVVTKDNSTFCETRIPVSILQNTFQPNISAKVEKTLLDCNHPKVTLLAQTTNTNSVSYLWNFNGTPNSQQGDSIVVLTDETVIIKTLVNTYTLSITEDNNTCKSTSVIPIYQNLFRPNPVISNGGVSAITCITPTIVLTNQSTTGIPAATGFPNIAPAVASWTGPSPQDPLDSSTTYTAATVGVYTVVVKDLNNGCTATNTLAITDNRVYPDLSLTPTDPVVLDCGAKQMTLVPVIANPTPGLTYSWLAPPAASISSQYSLVLSTNEPGEYSIMVRNSLNGCSSKKDLEVINGKLTADFDQDYITGFAPLTVNFTNNSQSSNPLTGKSNIASVWNFGNGSSKTYSSVEAASALFTQPGTYTVTLFATKGTCLESKQKIITVDIPSKMEIPNVFTPNGDGVNDFFFLKSSNLTKINAVIIDRWGKQVYEVNSDTGNITWDGKNSSGKDVAAGTYFYIIKTSGADSQEFNTKGTVSIYR